MHKMPANSQIRLDCTVTCATAIVNLLHEHYMTNTKQKLSQLEQLGPSISLALAQKKSGSPELKHFLAQLLWLRHWLAGPVLQDMQQNKSTAAAAAAAVATDLPEEKEG